jgi:hypothetical protein
MKDWSTNIAGNREYGTMKLSSVTINVGAVSSVFRKNEGRSLIGFCRMADIRQDWATQCPAC